MQNHAHAHNVLDTRHIGKLLMKLTTPIFFGVLIQSIYQIVDMIFVGRYVGTDALAAMSIIMPIQMLLMGAGNMVSVGGASLISRLIGQRDHKRAETVLGNSIFFAVLFSIILTLGIVPFAGFWLKFIGVSNNVLPLAKDFLTITMSGTVFNIPGMVLLSMARAEGNARVSMVSMIIQSILNVALDAIFIIWVGMGISGAALAMVISQGIALMYVLSYYISGSSYLKLQWRNFLVNVKVVKDIFSIGISQFVKSIVDCISAFILVRMFSLYGGDAGLSAFSIVQRVMMVASLPSMVLGQAMQPILGFNYGAKRFRAALRSINLSIVISVVLGIVALIILIIFPQPVIRIFTSDPKLIDASTIAFRLMFLGMPMFGFYNVAQLVFPSIGKAVPTFLISVLRPLCFIAPMALLLSHFFQITGTWLTFPVSDTLAMLLTLAFLIPLIKRFRKAAKEEAIQPPLVPAGPQPDTDAKTA
jgi:putative MATE family efflux protein